MNPRVQEMYDEAIAELLSARNDETAGNIESAAYRRTRARKLIDALDLLLLETA